MLYLFLRVMTKMLGVAQPFGFATPTFTIEPKKQALPVMQTGSAVFLLCSSY